MTTQPSLSISMPKTKVWSRATFVKRGYAYLYYRDEIIVSMRFDKATRRKEIFSMYHERIKKSNHPEKCFIHVIYDLQSVNRGIELLDSVRDNRTKKKLKRIYNNPHVI